LTRPIQAKLKNCHEIVVRNRLKQLRKRQRDEALQAQEELLAGVATAASKRSIGSGVPTDVRDVEERAEEAEPYHRSMSPKPIDINRLRGEERDAEIISAAEDRRIIVCCTVFIFFSTLTLNQRDSRYNNVVRSLPVDLYPRPHNRPLKHK